MRNLFRLIVAGLLIIVLVYGLMQWAREDAPSVAMGADPVVEVVLSTATPAPVRTTARDMFLGLDCARVFPRFDESAVGYWHDGPMGAASALEIQIWQNLSKAERLDLLAWCKEQTAWAYTKP